MRWIPLCSLVVGCADEAAPRRDGGALQAADVDADGPDAGAAHPPDAGMSDLDSDVRDASPTDANVADAGDSGDAAIARFDAAPRYRGSVDNSAVCERDYATYGYLPALAAGQRAPLFLYFPGTSFSASDISARGDSAAGLAVSAEMARLGFVALSVDYDNTPLALFSDHTGQLRCLFDGSREESLLSRACGLPQVDCGLGIATWGHSLGGLISVMANTRDPRARAAWATGYGGNATSTLPPTRLRVVNGEHDTNNGTPAVLNAACGYPAGQCANEDRCLRDDGSGWLIVRQAALRSAGASADHCWFDRVSCSASTVALDPAWADPASTADFALRENARWLATTARMPL